MKDSRMEFVQICVTISEITLNGRGHDFLIIMFLAHRSKAHRSKAHMSYCYCNVSVCPMFKRLLLSNHWAYIVAKLQCSFGCGITTLLKWCYYVIQNGCHLRIAQILNKSSREPPARLCRTFIVVKMDPGIKNGRGPVGQIIFLSEYCLVVYQYFNKTITLVQSVSKSVDFVIQDGRQNVILLL